MGSGQLSEVMATVSKYASSLPTLLLVDNPASHILETHHNMRHSKLKSKTSQQPCMRPHDFGTMELFDLRIPVMQSAWV
jgi:hypothetical protein